MISRRQRAYNRGYYARRRYDAGKTFTPNPYTLDSYCYTAWRDGFSAETRADRLRKYTAMLGFPSP